MQKKRTVPVCYLRTHRRAWGLTQKELVGLLGLKSVEHLSRVERGERKPTMGIALACEVLFGIAPGRMFPRLYQFVEERVVRNVYERHETIREATSKASARKRTLLAQALERAITSSHSPGV